MTTGALERGRASFDRQAWGEAFALLTEAGRATSLDVEDLDRLAVAASMTANDEDAADARAKAYNLLLERGDTEGAAVRAFWLGLELMFHGETARGGGWLGRAQALAHEGSAAEGYLLIPMALQLLGAGEHEAAAATFARAIEIGDRHRERDLMTLGRLGRGQSLTKQGFVGEGLALLDEVMVAITAREVSPIVVGIGYCAVIEACIEIFDVARAREWTAALNEWCSASPDMVPFRGECLIRRSEILQFGGAWPDALQEAIRARDWLQQPGGPLVGWALYQLAELERLRGNVAEAEESYRRSTQWGRSPHPGLALLRLAQGHVDTAAASIRRVMDELEGPVKRARTLPAYVEIMLAAGDVPAARAGADELSSIARELRAPWLDGLAAYADGSTALAEGDPARALAALRSAAEIWQRLEAPYDIARARLLAALACRGLDDAEGCELELDAARRTFEALGAEPDLARLRELASPGGAGSGPLTSREIEVLRLVATGKTNRVIARDLGISEKTIARHLSNIFTKLGVASRAEATAYAFKHALV